MGSPAGGYSSDGPTDGIWRLDPTVNEIRLLRPFLATTRYPGATDYLFWGDQGFLTVQGDRVLLQAYPYDLHFDGFSWRMVNRLPAAGGEVSGWALQGPYVGVEQAAATGLAAGFHGIARCVMDIITNTQWSVQPCLPLTVPGTSTPRTTTEEQALLWSPQSPGVVEEAKPEFAFGDTSWDGDRVLLSFDPDRQGFWRGTELRARFHPAIGGVIGEPSLDLDLDAMPFGLEPENGFLSVLHYHPPTGQLFGVLFRRPFSPTSRPSLLFSIDPTTGEADELAGIMDESLPPFTFASFGSPPLVQEQIIPIVADTPGRRGTWWRTDLWLFNPSLAPTSVIVSRVLEPGSSLEIALPGHGSRHIPDVLVALGGGDAGDGTRHDALLVKAGYEWSAQVVAVARIWTRDRSTGGSFGHAVPAVPAPYGYSNHSVSDPRDDFTAPRFNILANAEAAHIDLDMREPGRYRHNLGVVNTSGVEVRLQLAWGYSDHVRSLTDKGPDVEGFRRTTLVVPPNSLRIVSLEGSFPGEVVTGWVPRVGVFGAAPAIVWTSMIDNLTGDATFVPFASFAATTAVQGAVDGRELIRYRLAVPVVAHTEGVGNSRWQTDLYGFSDENFAPPSRPVAVFHPSQAGECNAPLEAGEISTRLHGVLAMPLDRWLQTIGYSPELYPPEYVEPFETVFPDVVRRFPECRDAEGVKGGLEILSGSWFSGFSRTYTTRRDGGTYGGMLPLFPPGGWPVQHFAGLEVRAGNRINIGLFNGDHAHAVTHRVTLFDSQGSVAAQRHVTLESLGSLQLEMNQFFELKSLPEGSYGLTVLPLDDADVGIRGRCWAYVSVIDNLTGDPMNLWQ